MNHFEICSIERFKLLTFNWLKISGLQLRRAGRQAAAWCLAEVFLAKSFELKMSDYCLPSFGTTGAGVGT